MGVDAEDLEDLDGVGKEAGGQEDEAEGNAGRTELMAKVFGPALEAGVIESARPMGGDGVLSVHGVRLAKKVWNANGIRRKWSIGLWSSGRISDWRLRTPTRETRAGLAGQGADFGR